MNRLLSAHLFWPLLERLCGRDTMARLQTLRTSERMDAPALRRLQERKLQRLTALAAQHCRFYAERFREAGLPDDGFGLEGLTHLPLLTRDEIHRHTHAMTWRGAPGGAQPYATGGSSGEPLRFFTDASRQAADWAARLRARLWWGVRPGDREIWLWGAPAELRAQDRLRRWRDALLNQEILSAFDMTDAAMDGYIERIRSVRPACIQGYASSIALLARYALHGRGLTPGSLGSSELRAVFVTGEVLLEPDRRAIAEAFGAPVVIEYGSRDGGLIACGCAAGSLHVPDENVIVELLGTDGNPVTQGETGEVVVTCLETFAMPIIRYRIGDLARAASLSTGSCPCGLAHTALAEVQGRVTDQIVCRDAGGLRRMHALALMYALREAPGIRRFRIVQRSLERIEVEVVCGPEFTPQVETHVQRKLLQRLGAGVDVTIRRCDQIAPSRSGKHACVISEV